MADVFIIYLLILFYRIKFHEKTEKHTRNRRCGIYRIKFHSLFIRDVKFDGRVINADKLTYAGNLENLAGMSEKYSPNYVLRESGHL